MKKITSILVLFLILITSTSFAQQDPQYTHYMYNMNVVNPAYAGSRETLSIGVLGRTQWVGIDG
ncbi:MAG: type IX secretion system membrane protein PorP/SprF, partial [Flavobacteriaceae bacterium]